MVDDRSMSCREAGRKGGVSTLARHGTRHFEKMGEKGRARLKELLEKGRTVEEASCP